MNAMTMRNLGRRLLSALCVWAISQFALGLTLAYADDTQLAAVSPNRRPNAAGAMLMSTPDEAGLIDSFLSQYSDVPAIATPKPKVAPPVQELTLAAAPAPAAAPDTTESASPQLESDTQAPPPNQPIAPIPFTRPASLSIAPEKPNVLTEAGTSVPGCLTCQQGASSHKPPPTKPIPRKVVAMEGGGVGHSPREGCYSQNILANAKWVVGHTKIGGYNRDHSIGNCAAAVETSLSYAGVGSPYGNAIDLNSQQVLTHMGFQNFIQQFKTPASAPAGAVLIFAGPKTQDYVQTGRCGGKICSHDAKRWGASNIQPAGLGTWLGHTTIKGDDGFYYTDGRTAEPAIGWPKDKRSRILVGVYLMQQCVNCNQKMIRACGG